jgi:PKD repeat protein
MTIAQSPTGGTEIAAVHNGTYDVTLTVSDEAGNSAQCAVTITAEYIPVLMVTCPDDITVSAGECNCSQTVSFEPIVEAEGPYQILYSHAPGSSFPIGTTTVTITVIDGATEEFVSCTFSITVQENERMQVSGNNQEIANGAMTPSAGNHTKMGSVALNGTITRTFTIRNTGCSNLMLDGTPLVEIGGANPSFFSVIAQPGSSNLGSCATTTFQIRYTGSAMGLHSATVTISNNAPGQDPYSFAISAATSAKLMQVRGNAIAIPDGDVTPHPNDWTDFGLVNLNSNRSRSFYIHNLGSTTLNLTGTPRVAISGPGADKFTVTLQPASTVLPGSNRQFSIASMRWRSVTLQPR